MWALDRSSSPNNPFRPFTFWRPSGRVETGKEMRNKAQMNRQESTRQFWSQGVPKQTKESNASALSHLVVLSPIPACPLFHTACAPSDFYGKESKLSRVIVDHKVSCIRTYITKYVFTPIFLLLLFFFSSMFPSSPSPFRPTQNLTHSFFMDV